VQGGYTVRPPRAAAPAAPTRGTLSVPAGYARVHKRYERLTDDQGRASFTPTEGSYYLVVAHRKEPAESGKGCESTKYSATLTILVRQVCPCCGE
jgi:hypothetical protein